MRQTRKSKVISKLGLVALPLLLLFLYLAGSVQVDSLHHLIHPDDLITLHSPEQERDTCHQSIYHAGLNHGCEHKSHLSEFKKCSVCDYAAHSFHLFTISKIDLSTPDEGVFEDHYKHSEVDKVSVHQPSRAPPLA